MGESQADIPAWGVAACPQAAHTTEDKRQLVPSLCPVPEALCSLPLSSWFSGRGSEPSPCPPYPSGRDHILKLEQPHRGSFSLIWVRDGASFSRRVGFRASQQLMLKKWLHKSLSLSLSLSLSVSTCTHTHTYTHTYICIYTHIYIHIYTGWARVGAVYSCIINYK